jgi:hypothetical protein
VPFRLTSGVTTPEVQTHGPSPLVRPTAWGFILGSFLFAVGVPLSLDASRPPSVAGWTFFAGSVLFTAAASLQFLTSAREVPPDDDLAPEHRWARLVRPRTTDWTASAIQLVGTVAFNVTTLRAALDAAGTGDASAQLVWRPDAIGSVLFLVSSVMAFAPEVRRRRHTHARSRSWAIGALNLVGSVFFGLSAIGAFTTASGELASARWSNGGTLLGALCFLAGAVLLRPSARVHP